MTQLTCFKAYDVRGKLGAELNEDIAYCIGRAYAHTLNAKTVTVGGDVRLTSAALKAALARGLMDGGSEVIDIGLTGTEEIYFSAFHLDVDGGIEVTASHNPMDYNGMKFVGRGAQPITRENGLSQIQSHAEALMAAGTRRPAQNTSTPVSTSTSTSTSAGLTQRDLLPEYVAHLMSYIDTTRITPLKIVVNAGNGAAGHVIDALEAVFQKNNTPIQFIKINHEPDGSFPRGIPNPLLPECRQDTIDAVLQHQADMGIAWDGDFDRCFFFDHEGSFIEGYYIVGLLAQAILGKHPHEKIIYDPRLTWNTQDIVTQAGGTPIMSKTGHAFIKQNMRGHNAIYGGEMSAHHYFRDFAYCDSGMIPWLMVAELLCTTGTPLKDMVSARMSAYPCSGEINFIVADAQHTLALIEAAYLSSNDMNATPPTVSRIDGLGVEFFDWRFNVRVSNTEPLLRLNVESRGDAALMQCKTAELTRIIETQST